MSSDSESDESPGRSEDMLNREDRVAQGYDKQLKNYIKEYDILKAFDTLEKATQFVIEAEYDREEWYSTLVAALLRELEPNLNYEDYIYMQNSRLISDATLLYIHAIMIKTTFYKWFPMGRTLLTPHRRRMLMKTMFAEPRVFAFGTNTEYCLGVPEPMDAQLQVPMEIHIPPVYKMQTTGRHTIFWCHNEKFYGCGVARFCMKQPGSLAYLVKATELDFKPMNDEKICGFKALDYGTLFETDVRLYFIGDYQKSRPYLKHVHNQEFEDFEQSGPLSNYWVCHSRPKISIMVEKINDPQNTIPIRFKSIKKMIRLYPTFWTELEPAFIKRRPVVYMFNGIEMFDVRIENARSANVSLVHYGTLYRGELKFMMIDNHTDDEYDLDNYVLYVDMEEQRVPSPWAVTGVTSYDNAVIFKCGDCPITGPDHLATAEEDYRGNCHKFMFEQMEQHMLEKSLYGQHEYDWGDVMQVIEDLKKSEVLLKPLHLDCFNRLQERSRYANYFGFLAYAMLPRTRFRLPKIFDTEIDELLTTIDHKKIARHRVKTIYEEFERVNFPGTDVWKPCEFQQDFFEPDSDDLSEQVYRGGGVTLWAVKKFEKQMDEQYDHVNWEDPVQTEVLQYLIHTLFYARDLRTSYLPAHLEASKDSAFIRNQVKEFEKKIPDTKPLLKCMNPVAIFNTRVSELLLDPEALNGEQEVTVKFRLKHLDPKLDDSLFEVKTYECLLKAQNFKLASYVDENHVLDLNEVYPNDTSIHRIIAQEHFVGHGLTELSGPRKYEETVFRRLGFYIVQFQSFTSNGTIVHHGLLQAEKFGNELVGHQETPQLNQKVTCSDGNVIYCHSIIPKLFALRGGEEPLPPTLPERLMIAAIRGLYDRRYIEWMCIDDRCRIIDWYDEAEMPEAFHDLLRVTIMNIYSNENKFVRYFLTKYPVITQRFIAEHRPGILLWHHSPLPEAKLEHIKIITEMWPKNEYDRQTRVPRKQKVVNGQLRDSVWHTVGLRNLKAYYTNGEEFERPMLQEYYAVDFPLGESDTEALEDELDSLDLSPDAAVSDEEEESVRDRKTLKREKKKERRRRKRQAKFEKA